VKPIFNKYLEKKINNACLFCYRYYAPIAEDPLMKKFYLDKLAAPFEDQKDHYMSAKEGIKRVRKGLFAFCSEFSPMYKIMEDTFYEYEKCELVNVEYLKFSDPFFALHKNSQYKEILKVQ
jgi:hypothetical protein